MKHALDFIDLLSEQTIHWIWFDYLWKNRSSNKVNLPVLKFYYSIVVKRLRTSYTISLIMISIAGVRAKIYTIET